MCLITNKKETEELEKNLFEDVVVYKIVSKRDDKYITPFRYFNIELNKILSVDTRAPKDNCRYGSGVIHCFLDLDETKKYKSQLSGWINNEPINYIILKCSAKKENFVASGVSHVVIPYGIYEGKCAVFYEILPLEEIDE